MIELLGIIGAWTIAGAVKTGFPLVFLGGLGFSLYQRHPMRGLLRTRRHSEDNGKTGLMGSKQGPATRCWEVQGCAPAVRDRCPAFWRTDQACWRALKHTGGGHIQTKCLGCGLLLSR